MLKWLKAVKEELSKPQPPMLNELLRMAQYYVDGKPVADKLGCIRFEKSIQKYKSEHDDTLRKLAQIPQRVGIKRTMFPETAPNVTAAASPAGTIGATAEAAGAIGGTAVPPPAAATTILSTSDKLRQKKQ